MRIPTVGDLVRIGTEQVEALAALPDSLALLNRSLTSFAATVGRLDTLVQRLDRLTEPLEEPLAALAPRLNALVPLLDEEVLASLPPMLDALNRNALPALEVIGQTQAEVASIARSIERLMHVMDDTVSRLQELPGLGLVSRLRSDRGAGRNPSSVPAAPQRSAAPPVSRSAAPPASRSAAPQRSAAPPPSAGASPEASALAQPKGPTKPRAPVGTATPGDPPAPAADDAPRPAPAADQAAPVDARVAKATSRPEERRGWGG